MNLNLASGEHPTTLEDWVNIDLQWDGVIKPHVYGDAYALPFKDQSFDRMYIGHLLEHIWWHDIWKFWWHVLRVMKPGGEVMVVGPDITRAIAQREPWFILEAIVSDAPGEGPGSHKWVATEGLTVLAVQAANMLTDVEAVKVVDVCAPEWPNPAPQAEWQCAVRATVV